MPEDPPEHGIESVSPSHAVKWVVFWVVIGLAFSFLVFRFKGTGSGIQYLTCYAIEWSLSLDNLFVFLTIFRAFDVRAKSQLRALHWGIIGAVVMRLGFIVMGVALIEVFRPVLYIFGVLLLYSAFRLAFQDHGRQDIRQNRAVRLAGRLFTINENYVGDAFFIRRGKAFIATPLVLVVVAIESSDIMFAIDSIPAAFAITHDALVIFTANFFAILGLRSLYFLLAYAEKRFSVLKYGLSLILAFVGVKMIVEQLHVHISTYLSLGFVIVTLIASVLISIVKDRFEETGGN